jgi:hypothetical protein
MKLLVGCFMRPQIREFVLADRPESPVLLTPSPSFRLNSRRSENIGFCDLHSCGCRWEPIPNADSEIWMLGQPVREVIRC